jgi:acetyl esterase
MHPQTSRTPRRPNLRQRLEFRAARLMFSLPAQIQVRLSGRPPVVVDGSPLYPEMQLLLALQARWRPAQRSYRTAETSRLEFQHDAATIAGPPIPLGAINDISIDAGDRVIPARHYAPAGTGPRPLLVYYHGGGFVIGDIETHDTVCRRFCRDGEMHVLSIDYRLAPEHPFPAAVDDAVAAFRWAVANAGRLGALPDKVAVGGDSAGGNLAAVVAQKELADGRPAPCAQMLLYPTVDRVTERPSLELFANGFLLSRNDLSWLHLQYTGTTIPSRNAAQNPIFADNLSGLAPAVVATAGYDMLRDEGEAYAAALKEAGVPVILRRFDGLLHGFCNMATFSPASDASLREIIAAARAIIATVGDRKK